MWTWTINIKLYTITFFLSIEELGGDPLVDLRNKFIMMKVFPENAKIDLDALSVYEMDQLISMEMERQKEIEKQIQRRQHELQNKINFKKY